MKTKAALFVVAMNLVVFSLAGQTSDAGSWITESGGCKLWNPHPRPNESVTWTGECRDGYADGPGVAQWQKDGKPANEIDGSYVRGSANGKAVVIAPNGARYEGDLVQGELNGKGILTGPDGARYEGYFVHGIREGQGTQVFSDGSRYDGAWENDKPTNPKLIVRKFYAIQEHVTGSHILRDEVSRIPVPIDKSYAQLTVAEKRRVKSAYEPMAEDDEPPYPLHGLRTILETTEKLQNRLLVSGALTLAVNVNPSGKAVSVEVLRSPDIQMAKAVATILMLQAYKPAICKGSPCDMQYPFRMDFHVGH